MQTKLCLFILIFMLFLENSCTDKKGINKKKEEAKGIISKNSIKEITYLTALHFIEKYEDESGHFLRQKKLDVNNKIEISVKLLNDLMKLNPSAHYLKIRLVQVPNTSTLISKYPFLSPQIGNLYFLYTLANNEGTLVTPTPKPSYYDINKQCTKLERIESLDTSKFINEFDNVMQIQSFLRDLHLVTNPNTTSIFVNLQALKNYMIEANEYASAAVPSQNFSYIKLRFAQVDITCPDLIGTAVYDTLVKYHNDKHFCVLWEAYDDKNIRIKDMPIYDFNELCPNMCPK